MGALSDEVVEDLATVIEADWVIGIDSVSVSLASLAEAVTLLTTLPLPGDALSLHDALPILKVWVAVQVSLAPTAIVGLGQLTPGASTLSSTRETPVSVTLPEVLTREE